MTARGRGETEIGMGHGEGALGMASTILCWPADGYKGLRIHHEGRYLLYLISYIYILFYNKNNI